jgi:hypothetical protein
MRVFGDRRVIYRNSQLATRNSRPSPPRFKKLAVDFGLILGLTKLVKKVILPILLLTFGDNMSTLKEGSLPVRELGKEGARQDFRQDFTNSPSPHQLQSCMEPNEFSLKKFQRP